VRAVVAVVIAGISVILSGCAPAAARAPGGLAGASVRFRDIEYYAMVSDPGTAHAFTVFATATREVTVQPSSAARVDTTGVSGPRFTAPPERARWRAAGNPPLPPVPARGNVLSMPRGTFSFIPQGTTLTYQEARSLPASPGAVSAVIRAHLRAYAGLDPPATLVVKQLGFLLATAPLSRATRSAAWTALASVPGLRRCGSGKDLAGRPGHWLCVSAGGEEAKVLIGGRAGSVLAVADRLLQPSAFYPGVPDGSIIEADTFIPGSR
jgi:hypothetical protein